MQGTAFVTSTAVGEAAQESASIGGSFFTHHLDIALRGAGDADGDGRITLAEAFRYTAARTLAGTASHPERAAARHLRVQDVGPGRRRPGRPAPGRRAAGASHPIPGPSSSSRARATPSPRCRARAASWSWHCPPAATPWSGARRRDGRPPTSRWSAGRSRSLPTLTPTRYELARAKGGPKPTLLFAGGGLTAVGLSNGGVAPAAILGARQEWGPGGHPPRARLRCQAR